MLNEGLIINDAAALVKSEIIKQSRRMGPATPEHLEQAVFESLTGHAHEDVDWEVEDNQAGYYTWIKSFDKLVAELIEDGYFTMSGEGELVPTEAEPPVEYSHLVYPHSR